VRQLKPFKFARDYRKPHPSSFMRLKAIQLRLKYFSFTFAISTQSSDDIISLVLKVLLNACKFEGLYFSHRFFYDLMIVLEAMSLIAVRE